jgi:hypothetical protein
MAVTEWPNGIPVLDERGFPVLLADVPNAGVSNPAPGQVSGNPLHDIHSGKFGSGGGDPSQTGPPNTDALAVARMMDAVRQAARSLTAIDDNTVAKFLSQRSIAPDQVDAAAFLQAVLEQRNNDVVDILDQQIRSGGPIMRGSWVRVNSPRGFLKKLIGSLSASDVSVVMHRLEAMGHDEKAVHDFFAGKIPDQQHAEAVASKPPQPTPPPKENA